MEILKTMNKKMSKGFTLLELTVAISAFSILTLFVVDIYITISRAYLGVLSSRMAQQNVRNAMETVNRYIKQAREITNIAAESDNGTIELRIKNDAGIDTLVGFKKTGGVIEMSQNLPGNYLPLTSANLNVTQFRLEPSTGMPIILKVTIRAQLEESGTAGKSFEKGIGGLGEIMMTTITAMKGQYY